MKTASYLIKSRNGVYYARFVLPPSLRGTDTGLGREIRVSTFSKDPRDGVACARALRVELDVLAYAGKLFSRDALYNHLRACMSTFRRPPKGAMTYQVELPNGTIIRDIKPGDEVSVDKLIRDMELGHASTPTSMVAVRLVAQVHSGQEESDDLFPNLIRSKAQLKVAQWMERYLEDVMDREMRGVLITKSHNAQKAKLDIFLDYCGDIKVGTIGAPFVKKFENDLAFYPARRKIFGYLPGSTVKYVMECVKAGTLHDKDGKPVECMKQETIKGYMSVTRQFLAHCADECAAYSPASKPNTKGLKKPKDADTSRIPFDDQDMKAIFEHPYMREHRYDIPSKYWVPHLAAYTGMRLNEISQLLVADVIQHSDTLWLISVSDDTSLPSAGESTKVKLQKRLKNRASRRKVPVHSKLIELGFLKFVAARKAAGSDTLFDLQLDSRDGMGQSVGRKFATYLRDKVGITDRRKVFHCFRHGFVTRVAQTIVEASVNKGLPVVKDNYPESMVLRSMVGHSDEHPFTAENARQDVHTKVYLHGSTPESMQRVMERLDFNVNFTPYVDAPPKPEPKPKPVRVKSLVTKKAKVAPLPRPPVPSLIKRKRKPAAPVPLSDTTAEWVVSPEEFSKLFS